MDIIYMTFPVFACKGESFFIRQSEDQLFICNSLAMKRGYYKGLELIDSNGLLYRLIDAEVVRGEGILFGYNIFFNRTLRVRPIFQGEPQRMDFDIIRQRALHSLENRELWKTRGDFPQLMLAVKNARDIHDLEVAFEGE